MYTQIKCTWWKWNDRVTGDGIQNNVHAVSGPTADPTLWAHTHTQQRTLIIPSQCVGEDPNIWPTQTHACSHTLYNPLIHPRFLHHLLAAGDTARETQTLVNSPPWFCWPPAWPVTSLLHVVAPTQSPMRPRLPVWRRGSPLLCSSSFRLLAQLSATLWPRSAETPQNYGPLLDHDRHLNQTFMSLITGLHACNKA